MLSALVLSASAANYKPIAGNLLKGGDFNSKTVNGADITQCFWFGRDQSNPENAKPYRGSTIEWLKDGGVGNTGCLKMNGANGQMPCLCYCNDAKDDTFTYTFPYIEEGKKYVAFVDVYRPEGSTSEINFNSENNVTKDENGQNINIMATKNGEWERLLMVFTAGTTGDCFLRVMANSGTLKLGDYILIDNFYFAEYNASIDYTAVVKDNPPTSDAAIAIGAVLLAASAAVVCLNAKKRNG